MMKTTTSLTIDADLMEMVRVKKIEDSNFNFSNMVNEFLRNYFKEDIKDLDKRKVNAEIKEAERRIALLKAQKSAYDAEQEKQKQEEIEKEFGKGHVVTPFDPVKEGFA